MVSANNLVNLLLAAAAPSLGARLKSRVITETDLSSYQAGAAYYNGDVGNFTAVSGIFEVPLFYSDGGMHIWVGIDGHSCGDTKFRTGVTFNLIEGNYSAVPWWEWYPDASVLPDLAIKPGHVVRVNTTTSSPTSGISSVENLTNGLIARQAFVSGPTLCQQDAAWMVEVPSYLPDFHTIVFPQPLATTPNGDISLGNNIRVVDMMWIDVTKIATSVDPAYSTIVIDGPLVLRSN